MGLAGAAGVAACLLLVPSLTRWMWIARLALRETSLAITLVALVAWGCLAGAQAGVTKAARILAVLAAGTGLWPFAAQWLVLARCGLPFSIVEYVRGPRFPVVALVQDLVLDQRLPPLRADVYRAAGPGPHPFVMIAHGGSWRGGEKGQGRHLSLALAGAGFTVLDVEYRLAPAHAFPQGIGDLKCLLGRTRERAGELGIDPGRGALLGRSAGGQMALVAAYSVGDPRVPPSCEVPEAAVQRVIALYAPTELVYGHANPMRPDVLKGNESLELYLGGPPSRRLEAYLLASPKTWLAHPVPRTLLLHGASDPIVEPLHSLFLDAELRAHDQSTTTLIVPFGEHGFDMRPGSVGEQLARGAILGFLQGL